MNEFSEITFVEKRPNMRLPRIIAIGACMAVLAACQSTTSSQPASVSAPASGTLARSATAGPGDSPVTGARAAQYFSALCGQAPSGRRALEAAAAANGFVQNTKTTTYYHPVDDLSVKLTESTCSVVFVSNNSVSSIKNAFNALGGDLGDAGARDRGVRNGEAYFSAGIRL